MHSPLIEKFMVQSMVGPLGLLCSVKTGLFSYLVNFLSCCYHAQIVGVSTCAGVGRCRVRLASKFICCFGEKTTLVVDRRDLWIDCGDFYSVPTRFSHVFATVLPFFLSILFISFLLFPCSGVGDGT